MIPDLPNIVELSPLIIRFSSVSQSRGGPVMKSAAARPESFWENPSKLTHSAGLTLLHMSPLVPDQASHDACRLKARASTEHEELLQRGDGGVEILLAASNAASPVIPTDKN